MKFTYTTLAALTTAAVAGLEAATPPPMKSADYVLSCGEGHFTWYCKERHNTRCDMNGWVWTDNWFECGDPICDCVPFKHLVVPCNHKCYEALGDAYDPAKEYEAEYDADGNVLDVHEVKERTS